MNFYSLILLYSDFTSRHENHRIRCQGILLARPCHHVRQHLGEVRQVRGHASLAGKMPINFAMLKS
jgi:hypothetical protein